MRKKLFTFLLALAASVGLSWATDPIVISTNTGQSSYTQGDITIACTRPGTDSDGFYLEYEPSNTATITNSGSSTISQIELSIGWFPQNRSYVRANGAESTSSDQYSITFTNVNSNNVTLTITDNKIQIRNVTITLADEGGSTPTPSATSGIFAYNYDCSRDPAYPSKNTSCTLYSFKAPCVGLNGIGTDLNPKNVTQGPWKVEFYEMYDDDHGSTYGDLWEVRFNAWQILLEYYEWSVVPDYSDDLSAFAAYAHEKLPVYTLSQWNGSAYQVVGYGFICAYAGEGNVVEHAALFIEAEHDYGCFLSGHEHSANLDLTFDYDLKDDMTSFFTDGGSAPAPSGDKLSGVFSISADKAVNFSKGNLQYDSDNQIWQFAANQWDYIGNAAGNNAITADGIADNNGIVDMFCWVGASSSLEGIKQYGIIKSWSGYGSVAGEALKSDWGNIMGGDWRTLSKDEWIYLLTERTNAANLRTLGTVNGKAGLILMPDGWTASGVSLSVTTANYTTNDINTTNWATLEGQGCAFLPAAGCCMSGLFDGVGGDGSYWSSTSRDSGTTHAHRLHFRATDVDPTDFVERFTGMSVRLVKDAN